MRKRLRRATALLGAIAVLDINRGRGIHALKRQYAACQVACGRKGPGIVRRLARPRRQTVDRERVGGRVRVIDSPDERPPRGWGGDREGTRAEADRGDHHVVLDRAGRLVDRDGGLQRRPERQDVRIARVSVVAGCSSFYARRPGPRLDHIAAHYRDPHYIGNDKARRVEPFRHAGRGGPCGCAGEFVGSHQHGIGRGRGHARRRVRERRRRGRRGVLPLLHVDGRRRVHVIERLDAPHHAGVGRRGCPGVAPRLTRARRFAVDDERMGSEGGLIVIVDPGNQRPARRWRDRHRIRAHGDCGDHHVVQRRASGLADRQIGPHRPERKDVCVTGVRGVRAQVSRLLLAGRAWGRLESPAPLDGLVGDVHLEALRHAGRRRILPGVVVRGGVRGHQHRIGDGRGDGRR